MNALNVDKDAFANRLQKTKSGLLDIISMIFNTLTTVSCTMLRYHITTPFIRKYQFQTSSGLPFSITSSLARTSL